jgi:hypothetical protein
LTVFRVGSWIGREEFETGKEQMLAAAHSWPRGHESLPGQHGRPARAVSSDQGPGEARLEDPRRWSIQGTKSRSHIETAIAAFACGAPRAAETEF